MKIPTKTRHALRMMLDLALRRGDGFVSLREVAQRMDVSKTYLEQIVLQLNKTGLLVTARGAQGGYMLARTADKCTVGDILRAMDGGVFVFPADGSEPSGDALAVMADSVWAELEGVITRHLDSVTLQDIFDRNQAYSGFDYSI
ncbi:MAG: Rrf2 family transcriptional regulator [Oscillospiraceae bacterium]|jgi:Rrf2 family protein|nr:Rrf2 family transcriptional regulator [Oscillospiraceae bacterium]